MNARCSLCCIYAMFLPAAATLQELDPRGKFAGAGQGRTDVWVWNATRAGQAVPLASCCTPDGFSSECQCASRGPCS